MDLGIARLVQQTIGLTKSGESTGSVLYAAPEQFMSGEVGPPADLYSLGVTLYELATGVNPFRRESTGQVIYAHMADAPPPLAQRAPPLSGFHRNIITSLLVKAPEKRLGPADHVRELLARGAKETGNEDVPTTTMPPLRPPGAEDVAPTRKPAAGGTDIPARPRRGSPRRRRRRTTAGKSWGGFGRGVVALVALVNLIIIAGVAALFLLPDTEDDRPPGLVLDEVRSPTSAMRVSVGGTFDESGCRVLVNDEEVDVEDRRFQIARDLEPGENEFVVIATDEAGNETQRVISILRE